MFRDSHGYHSFTPRGLDLEECRGSIGDTLATDAIDSLTEAIFEQEEDYYMTVIEGTDWQETPIVDIIRTMPLPTMGELYPTREITHKTYESPAPPIEESAIEGERCEIARLTRPLINRLADEGYIDPVNHTL